MSPQDSREPGQAIQIPLAADDSQTMNVLNTALSGMQSARVGFATSAHNVANLLSEDFRPQRAQQMSAAGGGSIARVSTSREPQEVDLAREVVSQIQAGMQYTASLRVLEVGAEMRGELIDLLA